MPLFQDEYFGRAQLCDHFLGQDLGEQQGAIQFPSTLDSLFEKDSPPPSTGHREFAANLTILMPCSTTHHSAV
jgi:hypothetical protein